jgi:hypothetical protein
MKIKLVRTGGFIPITKEAEVEVDLSEDDFTRLIETIQASPDAPRIKDGNYWELSAGSVTKPVDLEKVPGEYKALFVRLKKDLRVVK